MRTRTPLGAVSAVALVLAAAPRALAGERIEGFELDDTLGKKHALADHKGGKAVVLLFIGVECPNVARYASRLSETARAFEPRGVAFLGVNPNALETKEAIAEHARATGLPFPVLVDRDQKLADALHVRSIPTAVVLKPSGEVAYRGAIDDHKDPQLVKRRWLRDAIEAVLAGKDPAVAETEQKGCLVQRAARAPEAAPASGAAEVTYASQVGAILHKHCASCHRPGQVAPFSLLTYEQARRWSQDIKRFTQARAMPPWKPKNEGAFHDERRMTDEEIALVARWVDHGAPLGDAAKAPPPPRFAEGWRLGEPDLVLEAAEFDVPAEGADEYRCFVLDPKLEEDRWVSAVELRPGNRSVVHHILGFTDTSGAADDLDAQDPLPGYRSFGTGPGFIPSGEMGGWAPGTTPKPLPDGVGRLLKKGAKIVLEVHYHKNGKKEKDRTSIGLHFAKKPVTKPLRWYEMANLQFRIPAGAEKHLVLTGKRVDRDIRVLAIAPHMHLLGREVKVEAHLPDGTRRTLIEIDDWDFNWQDFYHFKEPVRLPRGTRIVATVIYDNSEKNPNNPTDPPREVGWGESTSDEMCLIYVGWVKDDKVFR